jgi:hypothetical protein
MLLRTSNLAQLSAIAAVAPATSAVALVVSERRRPGLRAGQGEGLCVLAAGLLALVVAAPPHSFTLLLAGSLGTGLGHGIAFLNAQEELNDMAPASRRGEVTAAFIGCIYLLVATSVIAIGVLDLWLSLSLSVGVVSVCLIGVAALAAAWQVQDVVTMSSWRGPDRLR